jgi:hypothetical protein
MKNVTLSVLSVGDLYENFTRLFIKKLDLIYNDKINLCITTDRDFSQKINSEKVICHFNVLSNDIVKPSGYTLPGHGKSTFFKYYLKSLALSYSARVLPDNSICHTDADVLPTSGFNKSCFDSFTEKGLYCSNIVKCSGDYHQVYNAAGEIMINHKLKTIVNHYMPELQEKDFAEMRCPIENKLYFNKIDFNTLVNFCNKWYEIGKFVDSKNLQRYGDCFEIKPACMMYGIDIIETHLLPFDDGFKGIFAEMFNKRVTKIDCPEEYRDLNEEDFLNYSLEKFN